MASLNYFYLHSGLKTRKDWYRQTNERFSHQIPMFYWFLHYLKQKVIVLRTFMKPICIHYCVSLGISQSSSTTPLLQKWTTMKRDAYNEFQWKSGWVFAPETVPEKPVKNMFLGPTTTTKWKLKAQKSWYCGTLRRNLWCFIQCDARIESQSKFIPSFSQLCLWSFSLIFVACTLASLFCFLFLVLLG